MSAAPSLPEPIVCAAIDWQMRLRAEAGNPELQRQVQPWLDQDARHRLAWQRLQRMAGMFQVDSLCSGTQAIPLLQRAEADLSRRRMLKLLGLVAGSSALLAAGTHQAWRADFATTTGERRHVALADEGELLLNTDSAVDIHGHQLHLRSGEVLVDGAQWRLRCAFADCQGQDARALVRDHADYSEIHVEHGQVRVTSAAGQRWLAAGEGLRVSSTRLSALGKGPLDPFAWTRGLLRVEDIRLADFLAELGRYRHGWLGCDPAVADLRLSGVFRLERPELILQNISYLLPVAIIERTRWWVRIVPIA